MLSLETLAGQLPASVVYCVPRESPATSRGTVSSLELFSPVTWLELGEQLMEQGFEADSR